MNYKNQSILTCFLKDLFLKLTRPVRRFFSWIIKSIQYSFFLRNDHDWDYNYILILLQYKLKRTRKAIQSNNLIVDVNEIVDQIKHAEDLLQSWINDEIGDELFEAHREK